MTDADFRAYLRSVAGSVNALPDDAVRQLRDRLLGDCAAALTRGDQASADVCDYLLARIRVPAV